MAITFEILNQTQGKQREVLIAFSKELRVANTDQGRGITDRIWAGLTGDADLKYLEEKQSKGWYNEGKTIFTSIEQVSDFIMKSTDENLRRYDTQNNFINTILNDVRASSAAQDAQAAEGVHEGGARDGGQRVGDPVAGGGADAGGRGGGDQVGARDWLSQAGDRVKEGARIGVGGVAAVIAGGASLPAAVFQGDPKVILTAGGDAYKGASQSAVAGDLGGALRSITDPIVASYSPTPAPPPAGGGGGGPGGGPGGGGAAGAAAAAAAAAAGPTPLDAAAAKAKEEDDRLAAAAAARLAAAQAATAAADEEKKKLKDLQAANPEARLEVFCDDESKKRQYNQKLAELLGDDTYKDKENEKSAFFLIISPPKETRANSTPLPYVTNGDFLEILAKDSFPKYSNRGIRICKMDLDPSSEGVVMGCSRLREQHWIDVKDEKNTTRIFLSKPEYNKLKNYRELLVTKFTEFLNGDCSSQSADDIKKEINNFDKIADITSSPAPAPAPALANQTIAINLDLRSDDQINEKAQQLADDFLQRRIMRGNLNCEKETTLATFENQEIGHVKVVRPHADQEKIEVYIVGNSNLKHVNLTLDSTQIMQIETSKITKEVITDVKYYNVGNSTQLSKQKINPEALKVKVNVFVKGDNEWIRHKIRKGGDQSKEKVDSIFATFEGDAPKIFTIEKNKNSVEIGEGRSSPYRDGDHDKINIKKKDGKYLVTYGGEKNHLCSSFLSTEYGCYWSNPVITKINGTYVSLQKKKKIYGKPSYTVGKDISAIITVEDENTGEIVDLKIEQVGHLADKNLFDCFRARNKIQVTEISKKTKTPLTYDVEDAVSTIPSSAPSAPSAPSIRDTMISSCFGK